MVVAVAVVFTVVVVIIIIIVVVVVVVLVLVIVIVVVVAAVVVAVVAVAVAGSLVCWFIVVIVVAAVFVLVVVVVVVSGTRLTPKGLPLKCRSSDPTTDMKLSLCMCTKDISSELMSAKPFLMRFRTSKNKSETRGENGPSGGDVHDLY